MENDYTWHSRPISDADLARALAELDESDRVAEQVKA